VTEPRNPYAPPKADAGSGDIGPPRPLAVNIALALIGLNILAALLRLVPLLDQVNTGMVSGLHFLARVVSVGLHVWIWTAIARGHNWARVLLTVFTGIGCLKLAYDLWTTFDTDFSYGVRFAVDHMSIVTRALPVLLNIVACILLFIPGRHWFARSA
jgi:hypothetical protein